MKVIRLKYLKNNTYFRFCSEGDLMQKNALVPTRLYT